MLNVYEVQATNKIKSTVVTVLFFAFVAITTYFITSAIGIYNGYEASGLGFAGIALIISGFSTFISYYFSDKIVLGISGARVATKHEDKLFTSVAENICIGTGLPLPKLYVIDDSAPNAFATGRDPEHAVVCVTTGLLSKLTRSELEAVVAHEISHIRNFDIRLMSIVSVMVGLIALLADFFLRSSFHGRRSNDEKNGLSSVILILGIIFAILSPLISQLIQLAISRRREYMADAGSVQITRQPSQLIAALEKISMDKEPLEAANKATAHLYLVNPFKNSSGRMVEKMASLFNTHPPIQERIKILKQMS